MKKLEHQGYALQKALIILPLLKSWKAIDLFWQNPNEKTELLFTAEYHSIPIKKLIINNKMKKN